MKNAVVFLDISPVVASLTEGSSMLYCIQSIGWKGKKPFRLILQGIGGIIFMRATNSSPGGTEDLLRVCSRSIVAPDKIILEANRLMNLLNDPDLEQKYLVQGCETLSLLASGFVRSGNDSIISHYAQKSGIDHSASGFESKDQLIKFCEFCVEYGEESLNRIRKNIMSQLEIENGMTKDEIYSLNVRKESECRLVTVQEQITNYIKLSLLVNSLKDFFKEYYKGLN